MTKWNGLNRNKPPRKTRPITLERNKEWKRIILERIAYLADKYGYIPCEYSGEPIRIMASVPDTGDEGWGHHIDHNRRNCDKLNCYIVKYKYHSLIHNHNLAVHQEDFIGRVK